MYIVIAPLPNKLTTDIQHYRVKYDPLANVIPPHITVLNPFELPDPPQILYDHLDEIGETHSPVRVSVAGWDIYHHIDYQLRLPVISGRVELTALRENLLTGPLEYCAGQDKDYWPHVHLGRFTDEHDAANTKRDLAGFHPQFIFRATYLELLQWYQPGQPWKMIKRFGLEATLSGSRRKSRERR